MQRIAKAALAVVFAGGLGVAGIVPAQAFYINGPGFHVWIGGHHRYYRRPYYDYYRGPVGGGWNTYNGCPPAYSIQDGVCKPYRGY